MKIFCTASKDTYITNKIINNSFRATDSNVGRAGTLDLFKLYNENTLTGSGNQDEISRILIKFDYSKISSLTGSKIDLNGGLKATLKLFDIMSGHSVPQNFNLIVAPLSQSFDEGVGRDLSSFNDLDTCNFITASILNSNANLWFSSGANAFGQLGSNNIDVIETANFNDGKGLRNITVSKYFERGNEDLSVDITTLVSASMSGLLPNHGFRISFSGTDESDSKTRFVKRFASRHVNNYLLRPRVEVGFDDSIHDNTPNFYFDLTGSVFLTNALRSEYKNLVSGSSLTQITGHNCLNLKLVKGDFNFITNVSQYSAGTENKFQPGVYSATFALNSNNPGIVNRGLSLSQLIARDKSVTFDAYWDSLDGTVCYYTSSLVIKTNDRDGISMFSKNDIQLYNLNLKESYDQSEKVRVRLFGINLNEQYKYAFKFPLKFKSYIFDRTYYRIKDVLTNELIFDFDRDYNTTRVSTDDEGMFFDFYMDILQKGRTYKFEFLVIDGDNEFIFDDKGFSFTVRN